MCLAPPYISEYNSKAEFWDQIVLIYQFRLFVLAPREIVKTG